MKKTLKKIDKYLGIKIYKNPTGLYTHFKGRRGERLLRERKFFNDYNNHGIMKLDYKLKDEDIVKLIQYINEINSCKLNKNIEILRSVERTIVTGLEANPIIQKIVNYIEQESDLKFGILDAIIYRNYGAEDLNHLKISGDWHFDRRPTDWIRIFVALSNINYENGPLTYINRNDSLIHVLENGYGRDKISQFEIENSYNVKYFTGNAGEAIIADVQKVLHKAGIPKAGFTRDMLQIIIKPE